MDIGSSEWIKQKRMEVLDLKKEKATMENQLLGKNPDWRDINSQIITMERMLGGEPQDQPPQEPEMEPPEAPTIPDLPPPVPKAKVT